MNRLAVANLGKLVVGQSGLLGFDEVGRLDIGPRYLPDQSAVAVIEKVKALRLHLITSQGR